MECIKKESECCCCSSKDDLLSMLEPYSYEEKFEVYSTMIAECFQIELNACIQEKHRNLYLICTNCVFRLREAIAFRSEIQVAYDRLQDICERYGKDDRAHFSTQHSDAVDTKENIIQNPCMSDLPKYCKIEKDEFPNECSDIVETKENIVKLEVSECDNTLVSFSNENESKVKPPEIVVEKIDNNEHIVSSDLCCVFKCNDFSGKIIKFTEENLQQCRDKLCIRIALNLKYNDIILPDCADNVRGYHSICRRYFTAIPKKYIEMYDKLQNQSTTSTSSVRVSDCDNSGLWTQSSETSCMPIDHKEKETVGKQSLSEQICIFCDKNRKVRKRRSLFLHTSDNEKLRNNIFSVLNACSDSGMERKLNALGTSGKIYYHKICKIMYLKKDVFNPAPSDSERQKKIEFHNMTYSELCGFIENNIINNKECHFLQFLANCYNEILGKFYIEHFGAFDVKYTSPHLLKKLQKTFGDKIRLIVMRQKKLIAPRDGYIVDDESLSEIQDSELLSQAALLLRKKILIIPKKPLPKKLTVDDNAAGECEIPKSLNDFIRNLLCGIDSGTQKSFDCMRKVDSISQDIIYSIRHGEMETVGMTLKNITKSREVIKELKTEVPSSVCNAFNVSLEDAILAPNYCTGVAYNNFDRFAETTCSKDTKIQASHDTISIFHQNVCKNDRSTLNESHDSSDLECQPAAKRRSLG